MMSLTKDIITTFSKNIRFVFHSSNYDGTGKWGGLTLVVSETDELECEREVEIDLDKEELIYLGIELIKASTELID